MKASVLPTAYDRLLFDLLPHLSEFKSYSGGEGAAYFIDKNFVIKEYSKEFSGRDFAVFDSVFESYCKEIQSFAEEGYSVPKIYAWLKVPNNKSRIDKGEMPFKYYILEENIPGRWIYYFHEDLEEMYQACKNVCSQDEFKQVLDVNAGNMKLKREILKAYIKDYIKVNTKLESMSGNELEKFLISSYKMAMWGTFSSPDLFRKNILLDEHKITLVDNRFRKEMCFIDSDELNAYFLLALIDLIEYNKFIDDNILLNSSDKSLYNDEIGKLILQNRKVSLSLTQKLLNIFNNTLEGKSLKNKFIYEDIEEMLHNTFKEDASKITSMIQTEFEK